MSKVVVTQHTHLLSSVPSSCSSMPPLLPRLSIVLMLLFLSSLPFVSADSVSDSDADSPSILLVHPQDGALLLGPTIRLELRLEEQEQEQEEEEEEEDSSDEYIDLSSASEEEERSKQRYYCLCVSATAMPTSPTPSSSSSSSSSTTAAAAASAAAAAAAQHNEEDWSLDPLSGSVFEHHRYAARLGDDDEDGSARSQNSCFAVGFKEAQEEAEEEEEAAATSEADDDLSDLGAAARRRRRSLRRRRRRRRRRPRRRTSMSSSLPLSYSFSSSWLVISVKLYQTETNDTCPASDLPDVMYDFFTRHEDEDDSTTTTTRAKKKTTTTKKKKAMELRAYSQATVYVANPTKEDEVGCYDLTTKTRTSSSSSSSSTSSSSGNKSSALVHSSVVTNGCLSLPFGVASKLLQQSSSSSYDEQKQQQQQQPLYVGLAFDVGGGYGWGTLGHETYKYLLSSSSSSSSCSKSRRAGQVGVCVGGEGTAAAAAATRPVPVPLSKVYGGLLSGAERRDLDARSLLMGALLSSSSSSSSEGRDDGNGNGALPSAPVSVASYRYVPSSSFTSSDDLPSEPPRSSFATAPPPPVTTSLYVTRLPFPVLHSLGRFTSASAPLDTAHDLFRLGGVSTSSSSSSAAPPPPSSNHRPPVVGTINVGILFGETAIYSEEDRRRLAFFDCVFAGSEWNRDAVQQQHLQQQQQLEEEDGNDVDDDDVREGGPSSSSSSSSSSSAKKKQGTPPPTTTERRGADPCLRSSLFVEGYGYVRRLSNVGVFNQGVDKSVWSRPPAFSPPPATRPSPFVVFSGGKLELRKGQDLVLEAFRRFRSSHEDAVLLTSWHNFWPITATSLSQSPWLSSIPPMPLAAAPDDAARQMDHWANASEGLPTGSFVSMPPRLSPSELMSHLFSTPDDDSDSDYSSSSSSSDSVRYSHHHHHHRHLPPPALALFPNRAEGGTNLVAMELGSVAVPIAVTPTTGQRDLGKRICEPQARGGRGGADDDDDDDDDDKKGRGCFMFEGGSTNTGLEGALNCNGGPEVGEVGWTETSIDEIVRTMEYVYDNWEEARAVGLRGAKRVWGWEYEIERILKESKLVV